MNENKLMSLLGYEFRDEKLLRMALTHSSYGNDVRMNKCEFNERLEFIGDGLLDAIIGIILYELMPKEPEGRLSKTRAIVVCERSLAKIAREISLGDYIYLGNGEEMYGGRNKDSILADCMEAIIGAVFMDGGFDETRALVDRFFSGVIRGAISGEIFSDYKSEVQEIFQARCGTITMKYVIDREEGPDHDKVFYSHLIVEGKEYGRGCGKSKKEAEQNAAKATLDLIER